MMTSKKNNRSWNLLTGSRDADQKQLPIEKMKIVENSMTLPLKQQYDIHMMLLKLNWGIFGVLKISIY